VVLGAGQSREPGSPGRAGRALCAPAEVLCWGAGCAGAAPGARGAACRPRRTHCTPCSSPASRLRIGERAFVLAELPGWLLLCGLFFLSVPSLAILPRWERSSQRLRFIPLKPSIAMSRCHSEPSNPGAIGGCDGHRNVEMCPATLQKTVECSAQGCHGASLLSPCESPRTCLDDAPWAGHLI
jgi:hypothetical protein